MSKEKIITFDPDEYVICPECEAEDKDNDEDYSHDFWIDNDDIWHFECFNCNHEWLAKAERKVK